MSEIITYKRKKNKTINYLIILSLFWSIPVILTLLSKNQEDVILSTLLAGIGSLFLCFLKIENTLLIIPFFSILAPIGGLFEFFNLKLVLSDWLFLVLVPIAIIIKFKKNNKLKSNVSKVNSPSIELFFLFILFIFSCIIGVLFSTLLSGKPFLYVLQLAMIYWFFKQYARSEDYSLFVIEAWIISVFLGSIILIDSFLTGKLLLNFALEDSEQMVIRETSDFFRVAYYYTGFHFAVGIAFVITILRLLKSNNSIFFLLLNYFVLIIYTAALVLMFNKSAIFGVLITLFLIHIILWNQFKRGFVKRLFPFILFTIFIFYAYDDLNYFSYNSDLMIDQITSSSSFITRLEVIESALHTFISYPIQIIFGMGPTFIETGNNLIADRFKVSSVTGGLEGTIDSGWILYLIELGTASFILIIVMVYKSFKLVYSNICALEDFVHLQTKYIFIFGGILFTSIELFTQTLGYAKIFWFPFQLILLSFFLKRNKTSLE